MSKRGYLDGSLRAARRIFGVHVGHSVTRFNRCVGGRLKGLHLSWAEMQDEFTKAAKGCQGIRGFSRKFETEVGQERPWKTGAWRQQRRAMLRED